MKFVSLVLTAMDVTSSSGPLVQIRKEHPFLHANPTAEQVRGKAALCSLPSEAVQAAQVWVPRPQNYYWLLSQTKLICG